jgi:hypothetical protein
VHIHLQKGLAIVFQTCTPPYPPLHHALHVSCFTAGVAHVCFKFTVVGWLSENGTSHGHPMHDHLLQCSPVPAATLSLSMPRERSRFGCEEWSTRSAPGWWLVATAVFSAGCSAACRALARCAALLAVHAATGIRVRGRSAASHLRAAVALREEQEAGPQLSQICAHAPDV